MENERVEKLLSIIKEIVNHVEESVAKKLELEQCESIVQKLSSFSSDCDDCRQYFTDFENHLFQLRDRSSELGKTDYSNHDQMLTALRAHLQKQHKLLTSGYYLSIYMSLGISLGVVFGLVIFDNIGLGIGFGLGTGLAVGIALDEDAKKKGKVL